MKTIGQRIRELREAENMTQKQVSDYLEIDRSNYSKYETGKLEFNNEMLIKLTKLFDVSADYILGIEK